MVFFDQSYDFNKFHEVFDYIKIHKPKEVLYYAPFEHQLDWFSTIFDRKNHFHYFKKSENVKKLEILLNETNTRFYILFGSENSNLYDEILNELSEKIKIIFWPTAVLLLEYMNLIDKIDYIKLDDEIKNIDDLEIGKNFEKLFINYNNKPRYHRCMMIDYLKKHSLLDYGLFTWNQKSETLDIDFTDNYKFQYWNEEITKIDDFEYRVNDEHRKNLLDTKCLISLVTERCDKFIFITEKTYRPILLNQPFICLASPKYHSTLQKLGFLLYDEIFDYSFDDENDLEKRVEGIIRNLNNLKNENYKDLYNKIRHKIVHNKKRALEIIKLGLYIPEIFKNYCLEYVQKNEIRAPENNLLIIPQLVKFHKDKPINNKLIWEEFFHFSKNKFSDYTPKIISNTKYYAVIIEPRCIEDINVTMKSTMYYLNENDSDIKWGLQIFHGNKNEEFIKEMTKNWINVEYVNMGVDNFTHEEHSRYMETPEFWKQVKGDKVLIFQPDSMLIRHGIDEFIDYDYIGAPWRKTKENQIVGNGGLSLRTKRKMIEITEKHQPTEPILEDIFFIKHLNGENVADFETAKKFSMEDVYSENPLGVHRPIKHIEPNLLRKVLFKI